MTDLDKLIAAVSEGTLIGENLMVSRDLSEAMDNVAGESWGDVCSAYEGSLDAVRDLHNALLPDWKVKTIHQFEAGQWHVAIYRQMGSMWPKWEPYPETQAVNDIASRAWLVAVLDAIQKGQAA